MVRIIRWCKITRKRSFFKTFIPWMMRALENVLQETNLQCHGELMSQSLGVIPLASQCSKRMLWWGPWHSTQDCGSTGLLMGTLEHSYPTTAKIWLHHRHLWGYMTKVALQWTRAAKCLERLSQKTWSICCWRNRHSGQVNFTSALKAMQKAMFLVMAGFIDWIMVK